MQAHPSNRGMATSPQFPDQAVTAAAVPTRHGRGRPGVLLDRDGTIIVDHGYVGTIERVEMIPGAAAAIASLNHVGLPVAVLTNQAGVARGYFGLEDVEAVNSHISEQLARHGAHVDLFLFCPYHPEGVVEAFAHSSEDRKPGPGMAKAAAQALGLDLQSCWVVGDRPEDMELAANIGATPLWVGPPDGAPQGVPELPSLAEAAAYIMERLAA